MSAFSRLAKETDVPDETPRPPEAPRSGADDLVEQMKQARGEGAAPLPKVTPSGRLPGKVKAPRRKPVDRASANLPLKKILWVPAIAVGIVCTGVAVYALITGLLFTAAGGQTEVQSALGKLGLTKQQGTFGPIFTKTDKVGQKEAWELVSSPQGIDYLIRPGADKLKWSDEGHPIPTQTIQMGGKEYETDLAWMLASQSELYELIKRQQEAGQTQGKRNLTFAVILLVVGPFLVLMGLWMFRDVRIVKAREAKAEATAAERNAG